VLLLTFAAAAPAPAAVVVNEIMYHPPDDRDDLQFVELHNTGDAPVDLAGWRLKGARYQFPAGSSIAANGYLVVCKDAKAFKPQSLNASKIVGATTKLNITAAPNQVPSAR